MSENQDAPVEGDDELAPEIQTEEGNEEKQPEEAREPVEQEGADEPEAVDPAEEERLRKKRERRQRSRDARKQKLEAYDRIKSAGAGDEPKEADFEDYGDYQAAKAVWRYRHTDHDAQVKAAEAEAKAAEEAERADLEREWQESRAEASARYPDFEQVINNPNLQVSEDLADAIKASEMSADVAYHLAKNPAESARLSLLPPMEIAREIGRAEMRIAAASMKKKTKAPPPPETLQAGAGVTTRDPAKMSFAEYEKWRMGR